MGALRVCTAICKSQNGESGNEMRGMMGMWEITVGMWGIRVGMMGIRRIREGMWGIGVGIRAIGLRSGENLRTRVEIMNKKCGQG